MKIRWRYSLENLRAAGTKFDQVWMMMVRDVSLRSDLRNDGTGVLRSEAVDERMHGRWRVMKVGEAIQVGTRVHTLTSTTMSNHCIPPEIWDHIVDFLHDHPETLMQCCLVSRSWVSRTRKHLFAIVKFSSPAYFEAWKKTSPDPSNSPAHYTHALSIGLGAVTAADAAEGYWIPTFFRIVSLEVFVGGENNLEKYQLPRSTTPSSPSA